MAGGLMTEVDKQEVLASLAQVAVERLGNQLNDRIMHGGHHKGLLSEGIGG